VRPAPLLTISSTPRAVVVPDEWVSRVSGIDRVSRVGRFSKVSRFRRLAQIGQYLLMCRRHRWW
jgi:hypothetical protein